jgi:MFS family permease
MTDPNPADGTLTSRTFLGLLAAQFLAAFNDQAIHAAAMFYAINTQLMTERDAISLMPILFYAPWAIFCTIAGWLADKYSKRQALVFWKIAEVLICGVALLGFYLGRHGEPRLGPMLCLAAVFLMGTHSAFFVPAKYGVMPEILPPRLLSRGNGILESLSFLAVILGTVCGGVLSYLYLGREEMIGMILLALAIVGAVASLLIRKMPAANPANPFPAYIYGPLVRNVRTLYALPPLRLVLQGLVFFTFVVAFLRASVYMLGEAQNPRWDELKTSAVVGTVALGIGLGSPLAGWLSGRRIELRLVLLGAAGMAALLVAAGVFVEKVTVLVGCIIGIGFFTGFYIVPLFTLLQHKAPKGTKGELIATSNFVNVTGAISASLLFFAVVLVAQSTGLAPKVTDRQELGVGTVKEFALEHGRPVAFVLDRDDGQALLGGTRPEAGHELSLMDVLNHVFEPGRDAAVIEVHKDVPLKPGARVAVSRFEVAGVTHFDLVPEGTTPVADYDNRLLPRYLFFGAAILTIIMLLLLIRPVLRLKDSVNAG